MACFCLLRAPVLSLALLAADVTVDSVLCPASSVSMIALVAWCGPNAVVRYDPRIEPYFSASTHKILFAITFDSQLIPTYRL